MEVDWESLEKMKMEMKELDESDGSIFERLKKNSAMAMEEV